MICWGRIRQAGVEVLADNVYYKPLLQEGHLLDAVLSNSQCTCNIISTPWENASKLNGKLNGKQGSCIQVKAQQTKWQYAITLGLQQHKAMQSHNMRLQVKCSPQGSIPAFHKG